MFIKKSSRADTRTCDWSKVEKQQLLEQSEKHIEDVGQGFDYFMQQMAWARNNHDFTKITFIDDFFNDFKSGFKNTKWWEMHQDIERHHFNTPEFIQENINLIDVIEQIIDGVMAGMARSGEYRFEPLSNELLQKAYHNTAKMLLDNVKVVE